MSKYINLTKDNFEEITKEGVVLLDFWAVWCVPCRLLAPVIEDLAGQFDGKAKICKIDTDSEKELTTKFSIRSIPTLIYMKDGEIVEQTIGVTSKQVIADKINSILEIK